MPARLQRLWVSDVSTLTVLQVADLENMLKAQKEAAQQAERQAEEAMPTRNPNAILATANNRSIAYRFKRA